MAIKCTLCNEKIAKTFLDKIVGTYIKKKPVCCHCQKKHKEKIKEKI